MGLDTSHDCWHGPYSAFNDWRVAVARTAGINLDWMEGFADADPVSWDGVVDPLAILLNHSDCEGSIAAEDCAPLADRLEQLLPLMEPHDGPAGRRGFVSERGWIARKTEQFIKGLRLAAERGEPVEFR